MSAPRDDTTAVVTGAAGGIGRAIAARMVAEGWSVVVNDRDADALAVVAAEVGATAVPGDAATEAGVSALLATAADHLGDIDVFVANAGIGSGHGLDATDEEWAAVWEVNVMAHVRAARLLVPGWIERGRGRFVVTASAAGLLTMLGDAPYSVTKHGAVAFAEWLAATYGERGVSVHAICPQAVRTSMYEGSGPLKVILDRSPVVEPEQVADSLWDAMAEDRFLVLPHPEVQGYYSYRASQTDAWLTGMHRVQRLLDTDGGSA